MACLLALALTLGCAGSSSAPPAGVPSSVEVASPSTAPAPSAGAPLAAAEPVSSPETQVRGGLPAILPPDSSHSGGWQHYGAEFQLAADQALRCEELLAAPAAWEGRTVRVKGRVADVCQSAGCWMVLTPEGGGQGLVRITMKDHAFSVAKDGAGRQAELEGVLVGKAVDPATVAHYQSEAGAPGMVPEAQAQGGRSYEIVASAVRLRNPG
jgi:hypothetical protein